MRTADTQHTKQIRRVCPNCKTTNDMERSLWSTYVIWTCPECGTDILIDATAQKENN